MDRSSQEFDRQLLTLKMSELARQMQIKSQESDRAANTASRTTGGSLLLKMVDGQLTLLREWLAGVDRICREVREIQREIVTAEFVRDVLVQEAMNLVEVRRSTVTASIASVASRMGGLEDPHPAQHHLAMEVNRLKGEVSAKYEIEARTLEHKQAHKPKPKLPEPVKTVNTGFTSVNLTKAPAPPREVGGRGEGPYQPKPTEVPHEPPMYFSSDLWPKTNVILLKAQRGFPLQTQTVYLCKRIVSEMTPLFVEAVRAGQMKPANVLCEHGGGMEDLLHLLLVRNDPGPHSGWGISDAAYRLGQEVRKSDEWLRLGEAIAEAQRQSIEADRFRTGGKQAESSPAQNGEKTTRERLDHREEIEELSKWDNVKLALRFGEARPYVKELCEIEGKLHYNWKMSSLDSALELRRRREELFEVLLREYPEAAKKLGLQSRAPARPEAQRSNTVSSAQNNGETAQSMGTKVSDVIANFGDVLTGVGGASESSPKTEGRAGWISAALRTEVRDESPAARRAALKKSIAKNIQRLRKECGWSLGTLADKTGIDKKAILAHVHGKSKPNPRTQREYAQAFAKELNRQITANSLEE